jgi:hypothetical protein
MKDQYGVPEIFEGEAHGLLAEVYCDIQFVLKVPIVNFMFRTLGLYKDFLALGWEQVRPNMLTVEMEQAANQLRYPAIGIQSPKVNWERYYDKSTIERIKKIIFTFNYVNPKLLLIASAWSESLGNRPIVGKGIAKGYIEPGIFPDLPQIDLVRIHNAKPPVKALLRDIIQKHHAFDAASDFRALAQYPEFLHSSWNYLRPYVGTDEYHLLETKLLGNARKQLCNMPFPVTINRETIESMYSPAKIAGIMGIVSMFQQFLPGLIIDGEFFRRMICNVE